MRRFWDIIIGGERPKSFKKEAQKQIQDHTFIKLKNYGRAKWIKTSEIIEYCLKSKAYDFTTEQVSNWFKVAGMKTKVSWATHQLRKLGYPIIAGGGRKGYRYADEDCDDVVEIWQDRNRLWRREAYNVDKERASDLRLLQKVIDKIKDPEKKKKLIVVQQQYQKKRKKNEEREQED